MSIVYLTLNKFIDVCEFYAAGFNLNQIGDNYG